MEVIMGNITTDRVNRHNPKPSTVSIKQNADGTTSLHIDKRQVRLRFGAESEGAVEIVLERREKPLEAKGDANR
jgi:hypothetical protein